ncbi:MAG: type I-MYXAN CRISPR-associated endonuclease Cas1 [Pirellula sp.]|jgi:CRISPR-associated protein Cas1
MLTDTSPLRVMSLHALLYCERLFYLEEIEEIRVADAAVYAGRRLHEEVVPMDDESPERRSLELASETLGLMGKVDAVRKRDGKWIAYEHKRGRCMRGDKKQVLAWPSDRIQAIAYAALLAEAFGEPVTEARVRYHADNVTAIIHVDESAIADLKTAIARAQELQQTTQRPPITTNENLCTRCSLAPVCLPEEERIQSQEVHADAEPETASERTIPRLFPSRRQKQTLHVCVNKARVGRSGESIMVTSEDEFKKETKQTVPTEDIDSIVIHGYAQISTQAIHLCAYKGIAIQWMTYGGRCAAGTTSSPGRVQQRIRQYAALDDESTRLRLAKALVHAKVEMQLKYLLRCTRGTNANRSAIESEIEMIRGCLRGIDRVTAASSLLGYEGTAAKAYFSSLPAILSSNIPPEMVPKGRSKHPPKDRFNALLSYGYSMLFALVERSTLAIGLEPSFGFYHRPRSSAPPLVMDVMELFRTNIWEIPLIGSVNRLQWNIDTDFTVTANKIWLSDSGRRKAIALFEERLNDTYVHPHTGQSMAYSRMVELELRLLEKEWTGAPGMFAQLRLR